MSESLKTISFILESLIVLLLFFTPFVVSNELYNGLITAKEFWFFALVSLILFYWSINAFLTKTPFKLSINIPDLLLLAFYTWCVIRAILTPHIPMFYNHKLQMISGGLVVYFFIKWAIQNNRGYKLNGLNIVSFVHFIIIAFLLSGLFQAVYGLLQLYGYYPSNHNLFKITGSFFNPAPFALYLAVVFPMALGIYFYTLQKLKSERRTKLETCASTQTSDQNSEQQTGNSEQKTLNWKHKTLQLLFKPSTFLLQSKNHQILKLYILQYISLATLIAILLVLPATMIRASWLGAMAGSILTFWLAFKKGMITIPNWAKDLIRNKIYKSVIIIIAFGLFLLSCLFLFKVKEESSIGKSFIWEVTLGKIAEKPLFGHGLGRFEAEYNNWQAQYFQNHPSEMGGTKGLAAGNTKYAFSEYLDMGSEIGILGLGLFLSAVIVLFIGAVKKLKNENNEENEQTAENNSFTPSFIHSFIIAFTASFFSLLTISALSYPFYNAPVLVLFFVTIGMVSAPIIRWSSRPAISSGQFTKPAYPVFKYAAALFLIIGSIGIAYNQYNKTIAFKNWQTANFAYEVGDYTESNKIYKFNFEQLKNEGIFLQQYGKSLQMAEQNAIGIVILEQASHLTSDYVLYCTLGDAYKVQKEYTKAEKSYSFACYMEPHKLYPNYLLAKLYNESGQQEKAISKANEVLGKSAKIESIAVKEIKYEMKKIIMKK